MDGISAKKHGILKAFIDLADSGTEDVSSLMQSERIGDPCQCANFRQTADCANDRQLPSHDSDGNCRRPLNRR